MVFSMSGPGDNGYGFRAQVPRTLHDIDQLIQRQESLKIAIGEERALSIEAAPEQCFDWEQFRVMNSKARFRSIVTTGAVTIGGSIGGAYYLGMPSGKAFLRRFHPFSSVAIVGTFLVSYQIHERVMGWSRQLSDEF